MAGLVRTSPAAIILQGWESESQIEVQTMSTLYFFQVFNVFLITTISGSLTQSLSKILSDWTSTPGLLASALPSVR